MTLVVLSKASKPDKRRQAFIRFVGTRRQAQVENCYGGTVRSERFESLGAVSGQQDFVVLTDSPLHLSADLLVVVDDEQFRFHGRLERDS